ncbi:MAG: ribonuclease P protein component [bacterium]|nr:ribonuclease P protein component [bacterium]
MRNKIHRLRKNQDFVNVLKKGSGFSSRFLAVRFVGNAFSFSRFGFLASGKIFKKAVIRNAIRRKLKEALRFQLPTVALSIDVVLIARKGIEDRSYQELKDIVFFVLKGARILNPK